MTFWTIICGIITFGSICMHERLGTKILLGLICAMVLIPVTLVTESFACGVIVSAIPTLVLSVRIYTNFIDLLSEEQKME